jgi:hypothetical protein
LALRELIYRTRHAWIQVLADDNDTVARFSITVTDPRFRFQVRDLTFYQLDARLGRSSFSDIRTWAGPDGRSLSIAARRREYSESYWFGNPGNYQRHVLNHNDAGIGKFDFNIEMLGGPAWCQDGFLRFDEAPPAAPPAFDPEAPYAQRFRAGTTINTLTVLGPLMPSTGLVAPRGPDADHVRVLVPDARERRRLRRRVPQGNRQVEREVKQQAETDDPATPEGRIHGGGAPLVASGTGGGTRPPAFVQTLPMPALDDSRARVSLFPSGARLIIQKGSRTGRVTLVKITPSARLCPGGKPFGAALRSRPVSLWNRR